MQSSQQPSTEVRIFWHGPPAVDWIVEMRGDTTIERLRSLVTGALRVPQQSPSPIDACTKFVAVYERPVHAVGNIEWAKHFIANCGLVLINRRRRYSDRSNDVFANALGGSPRITPIHRPHAVSNEVEDPIGTVYGKREIIEALARISANDPIDIPGNIEPSDVAYIYFSRNEISVKVM